MDHEFVPENSSLATAYHYLFENRKVFEYQTETDLLNQSGT